MSVLMTAPRSFGFGFHRAFRIAVVRDSPLIRWAAQSALISLQLIPHTFSVYVLKKMLKRRDPNWFVTQSSNDFGFLCGNARAAKYDSTHRVDSITPSFVSA